MNYRNESGKDLLAGVIIIGILGALIGLGLGLAL